MLARRKSGSAEADASRKLSRESVRCGAAALRALTKAREQVKIQVLRFAACSAQVAELADALDSGSSSRKGVEVRVLSWAPIHCTDE